MKKWVPIILGGVAYWYIGRPLLSSFGLYSPFSPIGIRTNNPMNLTGGGNWNGITGTASNGNPMFDSAADGIQAGCKNFLGYQVSDIVDLANEWSGNAPGYSDAVIKGSGIAQNATLDLTDQETCVSICKGIVYAENGPGYWYPDSVYENGVSSALAD